MTLDRRSRALIGAGLVALLASSTRAQVQQSQRPAYPETKKAIRSTTSSDESRRSRIAGWRISMRPSSRQWVKAENAVTEQYFSQLPHARALQVADHGALELSEGQSCHSAKPASSSTRRTAALQRQSAFYSARIVRRAAEQLVHRSERAVARRFGRAQPVRAVARWPLLRVRPVAGRLGLVDVYVASSQRASSSRDTVRWLKFSGVSWTKDGNGFFYSRFPTPAAGKELQSAVRDQKLYYHELGTPQSAGSADLRASGSSRLVRLRRSSTTTGGICSSAS